MDSPLPRPLAPGPAGQEAPSPRPASPPPAPPRRGRLEIILILGSLTAFAPLSIDMYLPALPEIGRGLAATASDVQLTLATFFLGLAVGQAIYGPVTDRFGRKPPLYFSLTLFALASAGCALAASVEWLIWLRLLQALGAAAGMVVARAMVRDLFPPKEVAQVFSSLMLVIGLAPILAPMIGSQVLLVAGWRAIFWTLAAVGLLTLLVVTLRLQESHVPPPGARLRLRPALLGYARLLMDRVYLGYALCGGLSLGGMFAYIAGSPYVVIELHGLSSTDYGWIFGANAVGLIGASQINRLLLRRMESDRVLALMTAGLAVAGSALALVAVTSWGGLWSILGTLFLYTSAVGLILPNASALAMLPHGRTAGAAAALLGTLQFALGAVSALGVGALEDGTAAPMGLAIGACGLLSFCAHRFLARRPGQPPAA